MIAWWRDNIQNAIRHIVTLRPEICIESDASNTGWGSQIVESGKTTSIHAILDSWLIMFIFFRLSAWSAKFSKRSSRMLQQRSCWCQCTWPTKAWFPTALRMLTAHPALLPHQCIMLPQMQHPLLHLKLAAILVSGDHSRQLAYQRELRRSSSSHGSMELMPSTRALSKSGMIFAVSGSLIHSRPL